MNILANLSAYDKNNKITFSLLNKLLKLTTDESMITSGNAVLCLGYIAANKHEFTDLIVQKILGIEHLKRKTEECSRIINGHIITALGLAYMNSELKEDINEFVTRQLESERKGTAVKARMFFNKMKKGLLN